MKIQHRHVRGPIVVGAFVLLVGAGVVGGYLSLQDYPKPSEIVDIVNVDGNSAVLIRSVDGPDERSFISLFDRHGGERWGAMIPKYRPLSPARAELTATDDVVFVRTNASGQWAFFAFDGQKGHKLGRIEPFETRVTGPGSGLERAASLSGGGQAFEFGGDEEEWAVLLAFDLRTGTLIWNTEMGPVTILRAWLRERHILILTTGMVTLEMRVYDRQTGVETDRFAVDASPCVTADTLYYSYFASLHNMDDRPVFARSLRAPAGAPPGQLGKNRRLSVGTIKLRGMCGERGGLIVLAGRDADGPALFALDPQPLPDDAARDKTADATEDETADAPDDKTDSDKTDSDKTDSDKTDSDETDSAADNKVDDRQPEPNLRWRIPVPGRWDLDDIGHQTPDRLPLSGDLDAFVPVLVDGHLLMIDVDAGRIAWRADPGPATHSARLIHADGDSYMYRFVDDTLAVFDSQTGRLRAARSVPGYNRVWPRNIAGGTVWLARKRDWVVLDARTLTPLDGSGTGEVGDDIRANIASQLPQEASEPRAP